MKFKTELKIIVDRKKSLLEKYIDSYTTGNIKNLTIKEEYIMLEELKRQREKYFAELEKLQNEDLEAITNERFELEKERIAEEVKAEHNEKLAQAELNVKHYDFVIDTMEAENEKEVDEVPEDEEVCENVNIVEG